MLRFGLGFYEINIFQKYVTFLVKRRVYDYMKLGEKWII